jgi:hypothetical protein
LNKEIQVKHLKRWTLKGWVKTDILGRAVPWTRLILSQRSLPNDLNLTKSHRLSALLTVLMLPFVLVMLPVVLVASLLLLTILTLLILANWQFTNGLHFSRMDLGSELFASLLLILTGSLFVLAGIAESLIPLGFILLILLMQRILPVSRATVKKVITASLVLALACSYCFILFSSSWFAGTMIAASLVVIVLLNARLFVFFIRCRKLWFALAAIPFQLTYYLYSVAAFAIGVSFHLRDAMRRSKIGIPASR